MAKTMRWLNAISGPLFLIVACAQCGTAQTSGEAKALRKEIEDLKEGQKALRKELEEIKSFLRAMQGPERGQDVVLSVDGSPFMGDKNASLTLIEFSDYQCPFCSRHFQQTLPQIITEYVKTGKVKYVLRDFPLQSMHPAALKAAEAARCAGDQGKYWEMHDRLLVNPRALAPKDLTAHAQSVGVEALSFQRCVEAGKYAATVRKDLADGQQAGVNGTPTFFLGVTDSNNPSVKATRTLVGAQPYSSFKEAIDGLLASKK